jgi:peroxiredoxin Q/BCP
LRKLFGVQNSLFIIPGRETFVIDKQGVVIMVFNSMSSEIHITKALKVLKKLTN